MFNLSNEKKKVIESNENMLILGGPGSGKTTIALLKAKDIIQTNEFLNTQKILFLSFARATVVRAEQQAGNIITPAIKQNIVINNIS